MSLGDVDDDNDIGRRHCDCRFATDDDSPIVEVEVEVKGPAPLPLLENAAQDVAVARSTTSPLPMAAADTAVGLAPPPLLMALLDWLLRLRKSAFLPFIRII
eukprot:789384_1